MDTAGSALFERIPLSPAANGSRCSGPQTLEASTSSENQGSEGSKDYPIDLFDAMEGWTFEHLERNVGAAFLLSKHFQEYTRFLHIQHQPVTEHDFILFRVLGRGGFGAVNGECDCHWSCVAM